MQAAYVDKYEEDIMRAKKEARSITTEMALRINCLEFVGAEETANSKYYFYKDKETGQYYYDSDSARRMRQLFRQARQKRFEKK